jgi:hypothetical protein
MDIKMQNCGAHQLYLLEGLHILVLDMRTDNDVIPVSFHIRVDKDMEEMIKMMRVLIKGTDSSISPAII